MRYQRPDAEGGRAHRGQAHRGEKRSEGHHHRTGTRQLPPAWGGFGPGWGRVSGNVISTPPPSDLWTFLAMGFLKLGAQFARPRSTAVQYSNAIAFDGASLPSNAQIRALTRLVNRDAPSSQRGCLLRRVRR